MTFVQVSGEPTRHEAEELTKLWQSALWNNHIQAERSFIFSYYNNADVQLKLTFQYLFYRFMVDDNRAIFMYKDGAQAWEAKNYLIEQDRCFSVTVENKVYPGKGNPEVQQFFKKSKYSCC